MPRFAAIRNVLRGSKDTTNTQVADCASISTITSTTQISTPSPTLPPSGYTSLENCSGLISLAEAQRSPDIVYHSVSSIPDPIPEPDFPPHNHQLYLIPLAMAASRKDIKYRREGFEMMEARAHIAAVRADLF